MKTCGVCYGAICERSYVIFEFTAFHRFYTFESKATFGTKKEEIDRIFVKVEFNLECGNIRI